MRPRALWPAIIVVLIAGCKFDKLAIGTGRDRVVVHAVLNPSVGPQRILVEHLLTGAIQTSDDPASDADPIRTRGGVPWTGATVMVRDSSGDSVVATEFLRPDGSGTGAYDLYNADTVTLGLPGIPIRPGQRYDLRVTTPEGNVVTASTRIPTATPASSNVTLTRFDRDRDSIFLFWADIPDAKRYQLRIESPRGPYSVFVDSLQYLVAGTLQNTQLDQFPRVFAGGFTQHLAVLAVDSNYYDYYRSTSDQFTGSGLITHLQGGLGVFGGIVPLRFYNLLIVAESTDPIQALWQLQGQGPAGTPTSMELYVDSPPNGSNAGTLSGRYFIPGTTTAAGIVGWLNNNQIRVAFLEAFSAADTSRYFTGTYDGIVVSGTMRGDTTRLTYERAP